MKKNSILLLCLIVAFILITILVLFNKVYFIDNSVYNFIISFKNDNLTKILILITKFSNVRFVVIFVLIMLLILRNKEGIFLIVNLIIIRYINFFIKILIRRERPSILRLINIGEYSYPSGHAMISMAVYGYLIYLIYKNVNNKYLKYIGIFVFGFLVFLIGISRIYLGVHYFSDVISGFILSIIYFMLFIRIRRKYNV